MVSLRSASSPSSTRSVSRENTPEPDPTPNRRRSSRTSQIAARRKSSRLSVASVPPAETKQSETSVSTTDQSLACQKEGTKVAKSDVQPVDEHKTPQGAGQVDQIASNAKDEDKENVEIVARSEKEDSPLTDQDEVSSPRSSRSSDALALIEAQKYIQPTSRRRRSTPRVFDEPSTEEESELQQEVVAKVDVETAMDEDASTLPAPAKELELVVDPSSPPSPELSPSDDGKFETVATPVIPNSSEPATPLLPSPPLESIAEITTETSTRSRRKRGESPVVVAPKLAKRRRTSTEAQSKQVASLSTVEEVPQYFEVIVLGDANASVHAKMPRRSKQPRTSKSAIASSELVALYPLSISRSSPMGHSSYTPRSTFALYRFPLPEAGIAKAEIKIYGRKVRAPSTRGVSGSSGVWTLEADDERCRWVNA
ncbi:hypothetical protein JCM5353_001628 [Sporobolomyces roseus]